MLDADEATPVDNLRLCALLIELLEVSFKLRLDMLAGRLLFLDPNIGDDLAVMDGEPPGVGAISSAGPLYKFWYTANSDADAGLMSQAHLRNVPQIVSQGGAQSTATYRNRSPRLISR